MISLPRLLRARRKSLFLAIAALVVGAALVRQLPTSPALRAVAPGERIDGDLSGAQSAHFSLVLNAGQSATIVVVHRKGDAVIRTIDSEGSVATETRADGPDGELRLPIYAARSGPVIFDIAAIYPKAVGGTYTLRIEHPRVARAADRDAADAQAHQSQAVHLRDSDDLAGAISQAEAALALRERVFGAQAVETARSLLLLGQLEQARAHFQAADHLYSRAGAILDRPERSSELLRAELLDARASNLIALGGFHDAAPLAQEALRIREHVAGPLHFLVASSLATLADLSYAAADVQKEAETAERALHVAEKSYGPADLAFAAFLNRMARAQLMLGDFDRAGDLYRQALHTRERIAGADSLAAAESLAGLARVALLSNDNVPAQDRYLRALAIRERLLGPDHPEVASDLFNLGLISYRRRDFAGALARYQRALDIREKTFGSSHPVIAVTFNNIGLVYWRQGDYVRAEQFYGRALELSERLYGPDSLRVTSSLGNLGVIAKETGHYALAEERYRRAIGIMETHLGVAHPSLIPFVESLAILYRDRGEYEQAERMFERTISLTSASLGPEHPFIARHLANLFRLHWARGDWERALSARARVIAIEERNLPLQLAIGSERQKVAAFEPLLADLEETIAFHVDQPHENPAARDLALTTLLQRKGRIFDALADNLSAFRQRSGPDDRRLLDRLSGLTASLAAAVLDESSELPAVERQRLVAKLAGERERLEIELQRRSSGYLTPSRPLTLADVQAAVPEDAALVEFSVYRPLDPKKPEEDEQQFDPPRYVAYVVRHEGEPQWRDLGAAQAINSAVERFRSALVDPSSVDIGERSTELFERLIAPMQRLIGSMNHLLISPDGPLNLIPFEALRGRDGRYLVEDHLISYLTTGRDLVRMRTPRPTAGPAFVFADPAFGEPSSAAGAAARFTRLAATAGEARRILALVPDARLRSGAEATEAALKSVRRPRILHIATHGFFLEGDKSANPLLRAGLALAGANLTGTGSDDGVLTALEAANLDLWGTQLVALSACDTGIGVVRNGEGVYGLRRAFFLAGAESLVMSLWPVSDLITRDMMTGFYAGLRDGLGRGAALRRMQLQMLERPGRAHPFYWASFIQAGQWARLADPR